MKIIQPDRLSIAAALAASLVALGGGALAAEPGGLWHGDAYTPLAGVTSPETRKTDQPDALPAAVSVRRDGKVKAASAGSASRTSVSVHEAPKRDAGISLDALVTENAGPSLTDETPEPEAP